MADEDILDIINSIGNIANTVTRANVAKSQYENAQKQTEVADYLQTKSENDKKLHNENFGAILKMLDESSKRIENQTTELNNWNITDAHLKELATKEFGKNTTKESGELIEEGNTILNDNLTYSWNISEDLQSNLRNSFEALTKNREMEKLLSSIKSKSLEAEKIWENEIGTIMGTPGMKDALDVADYIARMEEAETPVDLVTQRMLLAEKKHYDKYGPIGFIDKSMQTKIDAETRAIDSMDKALKVTNARDFLINIEGVDKLKKRNKDYYDKIGLQGSKFSGSKTDWVQGSMVTNQSQKNTLNDAIINSLVFGEVDKVNDNIKEYIKNYQDGDEFARENAIFNITEELLPKTGDRILNTRLGAGFKEGSGMENSDFDQSNYLWNDKDRARAGSDHLLGMLSQWKSVDDMYPEYQENYIKQEDINKIFK